MVELYYYSQQTNKQGLHPSKQEICDGNLTAAVPDEGLFIEKKTSKIYINVQSAKIPIWILKRRRR